MGDSSSPELKVNIPQAPAFARTRIVSVQQLEAEAQAKRAQAAEQAPNLSRNEIKDYDKTGIFQQIVQADSVDDLADLEMRVELIDAIQRASLLQSLPQTALYFLEKELHYARHRTNETIHELPQNSQQITAMYLLVEGQAMVLGQEPGNPRENVINVLKKGEFFFDKSFKWAGLSATRVEALIPSEVIKIPFPTLQKIVKVSAGVRKRMKAISIRVDKRAEGFAGDVGKIYNFLTQKGLSYSERVRVIRVDNCIDCDACYDGCEARHGHQRLWKTNSTYGLLNFPDACRTCEFQHCLQRCAGQHITFDEKFREVIIKDTCTGCTHCSEDCPFGVIKMVEREPSVVRPMYRLKTIDGIGELSLKDVDVELRKEFKKNKKEDKKEAKEAKKKAKKAPKENKEAKGKDAESKDAKGKKKKAKAKKKPKKKKKVRQVAVKCDHCIGYSDLACVSACPTGAIFDISQRELFERIDLYGTVKGKEVPLEEIRPVHHEKLKVGRGALHAILWSASLLIAAALGWESYARVSAPHLSFTFLVAKVMGNPMAVDAIERMRSGEGVGHKLGWVGAALLAGALMYVPKKRLKFLQSIGSKAGDLDVHILFGLLGSVFAVYHTTFKLHLTVVEPAIAFSTMALVLITGVIGRYFYAKVPRTLAGNELQLQDLQNEALDLERKVVAELPNDAVKESFKDHLADMGVSVHAREKGLVRVVFAMMAADFRRRRKLRKIRKLLRREAAMSPKEVKSHVNTMRRLEVLKANILLLEKSRKISRLWHVVHIVSAIIMFVALPLHIYIGMTYGI